MKKNKISGEEAIANLKRMGYSYYSSADSELSYLKEVYEKSDDEVLYPYVPIRIVALLEGYFQEEYSYIIDADAKYRKNFTKLVKDVQFELPIIDLFEKNTITFGEYASMLLPCNNVGDILKNIKELFGKDDFAEKFAGTDILKDVEEIFRYRHIFCHEIAGNIRLEKGQMLRMMVSASEFLKRSGSYISEILNLDVPDTTMEMVEEASKDFEAKDKELHELIDWLKENVEDYALGNEDGYMDVFDEYRIKRAEKTCEQYEDGSAYEIFYNISMTETTEELINGLMKRYRYWLRQR